MSVAHHRNALIFMGMGLLFLIFIISMAFLAAKSDAENQRKYKQQHEEIAKKHGLSDSK
ncbi:MULTISPECIES: hypothetical protein [unclassified Acinetobacter]|uniref:hypothetical protein n=1 Tax=unclassified Acinetobacter TaxID=196816 RepID=UPI00190962FC|nr:MULTISPECIES: hypothetical protein [unclassified Acinetobacter]MBK0063869.1 hypothetical protein [Acinetobacter sp. S55]MBK0067063.1 hypothetical protein [Acinetobacter sp. S54]